MDPLHLSIEAKIRERLQAQGLTPLEHVSDKIERFNRAGVQSEIDAERISVRHKDFERSVLEGRLKEYQEDRTKTVFLFRWRNCDVELKVFGYMLADPEMPVVITDFGMQVADWASLDAPVVPIGLARSRGAGLQLH